MLIPTFIKKYCFFNKSHDCITEDVFVMGLLNDAPKCLWEEAEMLTDVSYKTHWSLLLVYYGFYKPCCCLEEPASLTSMLESRLMAIKHLLSHYWSVKAWWPLELLYMKTAIEGEEYVHLQLYWVYNSIKAAEHEPEVEGEQMLEEQTAL